MHIGYDFDGVIANNRTIPDIYGEMMGKKRNKSEPIDFFEPIINHIIE